MEFLKCTKNYSVLKTICYNTHCTLQNIWKSVIGHFHILNTFKGESRHFASKFEFLELATRRQLCHNLIYCLRNNLYFINSLYFYLALIEAISFLLVWNIRNRLRGNKSVLWQMWCEAKATLHTLTICIKKWKTALMKILKQYTYNQLNAFMLEVRT